MARRAQSRGGDKPDRQGQEGALAYKERRIAYREEEGGVALRIDDVPIEGISRLDDGQYHTHFFPFRGYPTVEALAKALVDTEGKLWVLRREAGGHH